MSTLPRTNHLRRHRLHAPCRPLPLPSGTEVWTRCSIVGRGQSCEPACRRRSPQGSHRLRRRHRALAWTSSGAAAISARCSRSLDFGSSCRPCRLTTALPRRSRHDGVPSAGQRPMSGVAGWVTCCPHARSRRPLQLPPTRRHAAGRATPHPRQTSGAVGSGISCRRAAGGRQQLHRNRARRPRRQRRHTGARAIGQVVSPPWGPRTSLRLAVATSSTTTR